MEGNIASGKSTLLDKLEQLPSVEVNQMPGVWQVVSMWRKTEKEFLARV